VNFKRKWPAASAALALIVTSQLLLFLHVGATENCVFDIVEEKDSFSVVVTRTVDLCFRKAFQAKGKGSLTEEEYIDHLIAYESRTSPRQSWHTQRPFSCWVCSSVDANQPFEISPVSLIIPSRDTGSVQCGRAETGRDCNGGAFMT
jgi:hypothetical protein